MIDYLFSNPNITIPQIVQKLSIAKSTIDKAVAELKKTGAIERVGSKKSGYWRVKESK